MQQSEQPTVEAPQRKRQQLGKRSSRSSQQSQPRAKGKGQTHGVNRPHRPVTDKQARSISRRASESAPDVEQQVQVRERRREQGELKKTCDRLTGVSATDGRILRGQEEGSGQKEKKEENEGIIDRRKYRQRDKSDDADKSHDNCLSWFDPIWRRARELDRLWSK